MGYFNYPNGLFEIQVKLPKNWVLITHMFFQCNQNNAGIVGWSPTGSSINDIVDSIMFHITQ